MGGGTAFKMSVDIHVEKLTSGCMQDAQNRDVKTEIWIWMHLPSLKYALQGNYLPLLFLFPLSKALKRSKSLLCNYTEMG